MRRLLRWLMWIAIVLIVVIGFAAWWSRPVTPEAFYTAQNTPEKPGALIKHEAFHNKVPGSAHAWRILYTTTQADGTPTTASAIVMVSSQASNEPRPIVAWAHGTTGIEPGCGPSLLGDPFAFVPGVDALLAHGWIYVATDYAGQGTDGQNPYLVGPGEARSTLDAVRAARQLEDLHASDRVVVWGHSQGGHTALWTGSVAPSYAPELKIAGIAAIAPATDLNGLIDIVQHTPVGRLMTSYVLTAYSRVYPDVAFDTYTSGWKATMARSMASRCLDGAKALFIVAQTTTVHDTIFKMPPNDGALGKRLAENVPNQPVTQPLLIAQGLADDLVLPDVQARFVKQRCAAGQVIDYRAYDGLDHIGIVAPKSRSAEDLVRWTEERFEGAPAPSECREVTQAASN